MMHLLAQTGTNISSSPIIWAFIFIGIALVLFFIEIFVPSGGLLALMGAIAVIGSLIAFFMHDVNTGWIAFGTYVVFGPVLAWIAFRIWAASPLAKRMILGGIVEEDVDEAMQASRAKQEARLAELQTFIGKKGKTITVLRPVGVVRIDGKRVDALAESGSIEADKRIEVITVYDNQVKVREVQESGDSEDSGG
jgi:membrane-bound serine protease (ClpP class)